jgi:hypothetical protein
MNLSRNSIGASAAAILMSLILVADAGAQKQKLPFQVKPLKPALIISKFKATREGSKVILDITVTHNSILRSDSPNPADDGAPQAGSYRIQRWTGSEWEADAFKTGELLIKPNQNHSFRVEAPAATKYRLRVVTKVTGKEEYKECSPPAPEYVVKYRAPEWKVGATEQLDYDPRREHLGNPILKKENDHLQSLGFATQFRKRTTTSGVYTDTTVTLEFRSIDWLERKFATLEEANDLRRWLISKQCEIAMDGTNTMSLPLKNPQAKPYSKQVPTDSIKAPQSKPATKPLPNSKILAPLNERVRMHAESLIGKQVGRGECWDLAKEALAFCKAKTPGEAGYGIYEFGKKVALKDVLPGDILQFENVVFKGNGSTYNYPHHTAIVRGVNGKTIELLHQNVNNIRRVQTGTIDLNHLQPGGTLVAFRPQPR